MPSVIISVVSFQRKLDGHKLMLENMRSFNIRCAQCSLESDRSVIETQVAELFDGIEEPMISVGIDAEHACESDDGLDSLNFPAPWPLFRLAVIWPEEGLV